MLYLGCRVKSCPVMPSYLVLVLHPNLNTTQRAGLITRWAALFQDADADRSQTARLSPVVRGNMMIAHYIAFWRVIFLIFKCFLNE